MKIEDIKDLLEEIEPDKDGNGYIDCGTGTEFMDCSRYRKIIAAIRQNIVLQQANAELIKKVEQAEKQVVESLLQVENAKKSEKSQTDDLMFLADDFCKYKKRLKINDEIRLGNYVFKDGSYRYDPLKAKEPIKLEVIITENSDNNKICPICKEEMGEYPAISRRDNKTEICSHCGMMEALEDFYKANKGDKTNEQDI